MRPWLLLALALSACPRAEGMLVDHGLWEEGGEDPFPEHRPATVECSLLSWGAELIGGEPNLGVDTAYCNYFVAHQPINQALRAGDVVQMRLWHFDLFDLADDAGDDDSAAGDDDSAAGDDDTGDEPVFGHLALSIDGAVRFEAQVPIPSTAAMIEQTWDVQDKVPEGAQAVMHLHNHGQNSWHLVHLRANP